MIHHSNIAFSLLLKHHMISLINELTILLWYKMYNDDIPYIVIHCYFLGFEYWIRNYRWIAWHTYLLFTLVIEWAIDWWMKSLETSVNVGRFLVSFTVTHWQFSAVTLKMCTWTFFDCARIVYCFLDWTLCRTLLLSTVRFVKNCTAVLCSTASFCTVPLQKILIVKVEHDK